MGPRAKIKCGSIINQTWSDGMGVNGLMITRLQMSRSPLIENERAREPHSPHSCIYLQVPCDSTLVQQEQESPENEDDRFIDSRPLSGTARETDDPIGFRGTVYSSGMCLRDRYERAKNTDTEQLLF